MGERHFCDNPLCEVHNYFDDQDRLEIDRPGKNIRVDRHEFVIRVKGELKSLFFCSVCIEPLNMVSNSNKIDAENLRKNIVFDIHKNITSEK
jgi:hypothetical protein